MDGSSAPFLYLVQEAGVKRLASPRRYLKILRPVQIANGDKRIAIYPSDHFKVSYTISFDHPMLRHQSRTERITEQSFAESIAPARTFGFLKEVEMLRQNGLALGGSLENAIVIGDAGVLNALRFEDEFVRHKILDVVGDLALVGHPIVGPRRRASRRSCAAHRAGRAPARRARCLGARRVDHRRDGDAGWCPSGRTRQLAKSSSHRHLL